MVVMVNGVVSDAPNINYSHNMRILKLPANTAIGSLIYRLKGSDPDSEKLVFGSDHPVGREMLLIKSLSFREADVYLKAALNVSDWLMIISFDLC
jgi:hypothetical protein